MEEYDHALNEVTDGLFSQDGSLQSNDVLIFMTHCGPNDSGMLIVTSILKNY